MEDFSKQASSIGIRQREAMVAKVYRKLGLHDKLKNRWKELNYQPENIQLKLNL